MSWDLSLIFYYLFSVCFSVSVLCFCFLVFLWIAWTFLGYLHDLLFEYMALYSFLCGFPIKNYCGKLFIVHWQQHFDTFNGKTFIPFRSLHSSYFKILFSWVSDGVITFVLIIACEKKKTHGKKHLHTFLFFHYSFFLLDAPKYLSSDICRHPCNQHFPQYIECFYQRKCPSSYPRGNHYSDFYHHGLVFIYVEPHVNGIMQYIAFCIWSLPCNIMALSLTCVVCFSSFQKKFTLEHSWLTILC